MPIHVDRTEPSVQKVQHPPPLKQFTICKQTPSFSFSFWEHSLQRVPSSRASQLCLCLLQDFLKEAASDPPALPGDKLTFQFFVQWRVVLCSKGPCIVQSHHLKSSDMTWSLVKDQAQSDYILERAHVLDDFVGTQLKWMVGQIGPSFFVEKSQYTKHTHVS